MAELEKLDFKALSIFLHRKTADSTPVTATFTSFLYFAT